MFKSALCGLAFSLAVLLPPVGPARADVFDIDQVIDLSALAPEEVYRFEPDYLRIEPGDTVRFLNSTGNHTVTSVKGIWPEGAEHVSIEHQPVAEIVFAKPGVYGLRCKVHGRHGMYALVLVGSPDPNIGDIEFTNLGELGRKVFTRLIEKMNKDISNLSD